MSYIKRILDRCYIEAQERLTPFHYKRLINHVIGKSEDLIMPVYSEGTNIIENIRTKMDYDNRFYRHPNTGKFGLSEWYSLPHQLKIDSMDSGKKKLKASLEITRDAAIEARARQDYMINKHNDSPGNHYRKILDGFIIEKHLKCYFSKIYPDFYRPPPNEGNVEQYAYDDWYLLIDDIKLKFDSKKEGIDRQIWIEGSRLDDIRFFIAGHLGKENIVIDGFTTSSHLFENGKIINSTRSYDKKPVTYYILKDKELIPFNILIVFINHLIDDDIPFIWKKVT